MTAQVTQCPECQTAFHINEQQLQIANGLVRCGSCEFVFNAWEYLNILDLAGGSLEYGSEETLSENYISEILHEGSALGGMAPMAKNYIADGSNEHLPSYGNITATLPMEEVQFSREFLELFPANESPGKSTGATSPPKPSIRTTEMESARPEEASRNDKTARQQGDAPATVTEHNQLEDDALIPAELRISAKEIQGPVEVVAEELLWQTSHPGRMKQIGWIGAILVSTILLITQYTVYNFNTLAQTASYRPWLQSFCSIAGCKLPVQIDIRQIKSSDLLVRSHPDRQDALIVNTIMTNQSRFEQPFPILELEFTDLNGRQVAVRNFKPDDYLSGELSSTRIMPPHQPIHISLEILDPGKTAVNYAIRLHPDT